MSSALPHDIVPGPAARSAALAQPLAIAADLHKWRSFVAISEAGSLTRAALVLDSNQSFLSRQLNALERECRARLFNRTGRGLELSDVGRRILTQVQVLLKEAECLEAEIRSKAREPAGLVTLGVLPSIGLPLTGRLFGQMRQRHPGVRLKVLEGSSGQVEEWLADGRVDIAVLYRYGAVPADAEQTLALVDSFLIGRAGDALTATAQVRFRELCGLPFILPSAPNGLRNALDAVARQQRIALAPMIEADSLPLQKSLVAHEGLYTVLPLHTVWQEVQAGVLQAARIVDPSLQRTVAMATARAKGPARAVSAVAEELVRIVEDMGRHVMWRTGPA